MARVPECHPDRKHGGKGLCNSCYMKYRWRTDPAFRDRMTHYRKQIWRKRNPGKETKQARSIALRRKYGIDDIIYEEMLKSQEGVCAICAGVDKSRRLAVDHDHDTKKVRGLLCLRCNTKLEWYLNYRLAIVEYLGWDQVKVKK